MALNKNAVFQGSYDSKYRVLWVHGSEEMVWAIELGKDNVVPEIFSKSALIEAFYEGEYRIIDDEYMPEITNEEDLTEAERGVRDVNWERIKEIITKEPDIYLPKERSRLVKEAIENHGGTRQTYYKALRQYWQHGCVPDALVPRYAKCGGRGKLKSASNKKRGRPREITPGDGINIDEDMLKYIRIAISQKFMNSSRSNLKHAYRWMLRRFFQQNVVIDKNKQGGTVVKIKDRDKLPTFEQFKYHHKKENDEITVRFKRKGERALEKKVRPLLKNSQSETGGPGMRYQIDATIIDLYAVSRFDSNRIVGRPTLYVVIDVFSRMIVGFYIGLEHPSWETAMNALLNVFEDKVELCARYGIDIDEWQWPKAGFPLRLLGDGGEIKSPVSIRLAKAFNVIVENAAPYRGDAKGVVERTFHSLQIDIKHFSPGYVETDFKERGARDYREDAVLTVDEIKGIILRSIIEANNKSRKDFDGEPEMVAHGVAYVPVHMWHWGKERRRSDTRIFDSEYAKLNLLPDKEAKITRRGIHLMSGLYYTSPLLISEPWYIQAQEKGMKVRVIYHSGDMSSVYIQSPFEKEKFYQLELAPHCSKFSGKSLSEVHALKRRENEIKAVYDYENQALFMAFDADKEQIVASALVRAKANKDPNISNAQRKKDIRKNRQEDVLIDGKNQAAELGLGQLEDVGKDYIEGEVLEEEWEKDSLEFLRGQRFEGEA